MRKVLVGYFYNLLLCPMKRKTENGDGGEGRRGGGHGGFCVLIAFQKLVLHIVRLWHCFGILMVF